MKNISLNGDCKLYIADGNDEVIKEKRFSDLKNPISAIIPGNAELDLVRNGVLPNPYFGDNIKKAEYLEKKDFVYVKEFDFSPEKDFRGEIVFCGVDTVAEYYLNGKKIGESDNAFIEYVFAVDGIIKNGKNVLVVHIFSTVKHAEKYEYNPLDMGIYDGCYESINVRKPASSFGWDILPRAVSAGIYGDVYIREYSPVEITDAYMATARVSKEVAVLAVTVNAKVSEEYLGKTTLKITGKCKESCFSAEYPFTFISKTVFPYVKNPVLWYPQGYGEPNLYDVSLQLVAEGKVVAEKNLRYGIRSVKVEYSDKVGSDGDFKISVNDKLIKVKGVNHTPIDVYHSKDREKYADIVDGIKNLNCNFVRIWGGGRYEEDEFYSLTDEAGILVWHDFMLACHKYPQTEEFLEKIKVECENVIKRFRNHSSIICWCGSNETDWMYVCTGLDPTDDKITRVVMKDAVKRQDPYRAFFPTTPYFSPEYLKESGGVFYLDLPEITEARRCLAEEHYWWHRNDFLNFTDQNHKFIMETGYGGCDSMEELNKYLPDGWKFKDDSFWACHSYPTENARVTGVEYLFDNVPDGNEDYVYASRAYQAEAYKYIVERSRIKKDFNGICLWNYRDGFPIFSSAIVEYDGGKRPCYNVIKNSYEPTQCIMTYDDGMVNAYIVNDGDYCGKAKITLAINGEKVIFEKETEIKGGEIFFVGSVACKEGNLIESKLRYGNRKAKNYLYAYKEKINYDKYKKLLNESEIIK